MYGIPSFFLFSWSHNQKQICHFFPPTPLTYLPRQLHLLPVSKRQNGCLYWPILPQDWWEYAEYIIMNTGHRMFWPAPPAALRAEKQWMEFINCYQNGSLFCRRLMPGTMALLPPIALNSNYLCSHPHELPRARTHSDKIDFVSTWKTDPSKISLISPNFGTFQWRLSQWVFSLFLLINRSIDGSTINKSGRPAMNPPITAIANGWCSCAPVPIPNAKGIKAIIAPSAVINLGRKRVEME